MQSLGADIFLFLLLFYFFHLSISHTNFPGREGWVRRGVRRASWYCLGPDSTGVTGSVSCGNPCSCLRDTWASRTGHVASLHCLGHCITALGSYTWALSPSGGYRSLGSLTTTPHYVSSRYEHSFTITIDILFFSTHTHLVLRTMIPTPSLYFIPYGLAQYIHSFCFLFSAQSPAAS